jgi:anti-sigma regulatory factor (Ser/Thr protein kinase)
MKAEADKGPDSRLVLGSDHAGLETLAAWLEQFSSRWSLPAQTMFRLDLILTEAVTNVMDHASRQGSEGRIELVCTVEDGQIQVALIDDGPPFDPSARPPVQLPTRLEEAEPGGLGIHLMRRYTTHFEYRREAGQNILNMVLPVDPRLSPVHGLPS